MSTFNEPLSIKFIHKPSRSAELFNKNLGERTTLENSNNNRALHYKFPANKDAAEDVERDGGVEDGGSGAGAKKSSPQAPAEAGNGVGVAKAVTDENQPQGKNKEQASGKSDGRDKAEPRQAVDWDGLFRHKLVRKKSGEIVKPNLKDPSSPLFLEHKVSKSLPTTPNLKQVHFGDAFDVKYFNKKDRPTAISASNSPTLESPDLAVQFSDNDSDSSIQSEEGDDYFNSRYSSMDSRGSSAARAKQHQRDLDELLSDDYYDREFGSGDGSYGSTSKSKFDGSTYYPNPKHSNLIEWSLDLINFPSLDYGSKISAGAPLFLERIFISIDRKYLLGHVAVKNLSFEKNITLRYTFDDWQTIIEIPAVYVPDLPSILKANNYDRFIFKISLNKMFNTYGSMSNYQKNNYQFCIRYACNNQEFWDNNQAKNYRMALIKKVTNAGSPMFPTSANFNEDSVFNDRNARKSSPLSRSSSGSSINNNFSQKPRYSSSYLRRRSSDPNLSHSDTDADYVKNNFYLSSPLLSNFNNNFNSELVNSQSNTSDTLTTNTNFLGSEDINQFDLKSLNGNFLNNENFNSQSYKDLIDTYCFYTDDNKNKKNNQSSTTPATSSGSETDGVSIAGTTNPKESQELNSPTFTVSSLLGT